MSCINFPPPNYESKGVLYKMSFESGHYYYGITRNSLRDRYGTFSPKRGSNRTLRNAMRDFRFNVNVLAKDMSVDHLKELERLIVSEDTLHDPMCLNKCRGGGGAHADTFFPGQRIVKLVNPQGKVVVFESYKKAAEAIGVNRGSVSTMMLRHENEGKIGFNKIYWPKSLKGWHPVGGEAKKVFESKQVTFIKNGVLKTWDSRCDCSKELGASVQNVSAVALGKRAVVKGWMSAEHIDKFAKVMCTKTGVKYQNATEAGKHLYPNLNPRTVLGYLSGQRKNPTTLIKIK